MLSYLQRPPLHNLTMDRVTSHSWQHATSLPSPAPALDSVLARNTLAFLELCTPKPLDAITVGGWHGTSEAALRLAISVGGLRGSPISHAGAAPGHLFFYKPESGDFTSGSDFSLRSLGRGGAEGYASITAQTSRVMEALEMNFKNPDHHYRAAELRDLLREDGIEARRQLRTLRMDDPAINALVENLWERKGFLIALDKSSLQRHRISDGDIPGEDYKIFLPNVLPFTAIAAVIPLGEPERRWVEALRTRLADPNSAAAFSDATFRLPRS